MSTRDTYWCWARIYIPTTPRSPYRYQFLRRFIPEREVPQAIKDKFEKLAIDSKRKDGER